MVSNADSDDVCECMGVSFVDDEIVDMDDCRDIEGVEDCRDIEGVEDCRDIEDEATSLAPPISSAAILADEISRNVTFTHSSSGTASPKRIKYNIIRCFGETSFSPMLTSSI